MRFSKYQAAGNDYLVYTGEETFSLSSRDISRVCHRHRGLGSDGILIPCISSEGALSVKIFNTDGSQAEKSGNGLRIFCRFLWDIGVVGHQPFEVATLGGVVNCQILSEGRQVSIAMGQARFLEIEKPLVDICGREFRLHPVSMGNPHCVVFVDRPEESMIKEVGPYIETHSNFPQKTNVQFVRVNDRASIEAGIWERGVGYTLSSGTSSCAAAAVAYKLGLVDNQVTVVMPGGSININLGLDFAITMRGPVCKVGDYLLSEECLGCD